MAVKASDFFNIEAKRAAAVAYQSRSLKYISNSRRKTSRQTQNSMKTICRPPATSAFTSPLPREAQPSNKELNKPPQALACCTTVFPQSAAEDPLLVLQRVLNLLTLFQEAVADPAPDECGFQPGRTQHTTSRLITASEGHTSKAGSHWV